jgi:hypothetical protein
MKKSLTLFATLVFSGSVIFAGPPPQSGTILSQTSVTCGAKKSKKKDIDILCHQYLLRSGATDYSIRQQKPSDETLIPINTPVQFTLDKNKVKFKVNGKSYDYLVVGQAAASSAATTPAASAPNR